MIYRGSCHCGHVAFDVEGTIDQAISCNCSMCSRRGSVLWFVPRACLVLSTPEDAASTYRFSTQVISHRFCPVCGIHPYGEAVGPDGNAVAAINLRCIDGLDLASIDVLSHDGRAT